MGMADYACAGQMATDHVHGEHSLQQAAAEAVCHLQQRFSGNAGILILDRLGRYGVAQARHGWLVCSN
jgi:isoaspartyl peptidase/L-asparaginase-like protein (Ntn-hydrolase superfamily)